MTRQGHGTAAPAKYAEEANAIISSARMPTLTLEEATFYRDAGYAPADADRIAMDVDPTNG